jgi:membrane protease YdiL (CAAX protease family)
MKSLEKMVILAVSLIVMMTIGAVIGAAVPMDMSMALRIAILLPIGFLGYVVGYKFFTEQKFKDFLPIRAISIKNIVLIFLIVVCTIPGVLFIHSILALFIDTPFFFFVLFEGLLHYPFFIRVLVLAVVPGIFEELVFRGAILHELKDRKHLKGTPILKAALISSILFAVVHMNVPQFIAALFLGMICAYFMHYTHNIIAPILGHFLWNLIVISIPYLLSISVPGREILTPYYFDPTMDIAIFGIAAAVLAIPLFFLMKKFISYNEKVAAVKIRA